MLLCLDSKARGQDVVFTNRFATFTNLHGEKFNHVQLIRSDAKGIYYTYADSAGGGKIAFTDLSPAVVKGFGLAQDSAEKAIQLTEQELAQARQATEQEKEKMRDPLNWKPVHLMSLGYVAQNTWSCTLAEFPGNFLIYNAQPSALQYFGDIQKLASVVDQQKAQMSQLQGQIDQSKAAINNLQNMASQLRSERYQGNLAQANSLNANYAWNVEIQERQSQNRASLQNANDQLAELIQQQATIQTALSSSDRNLQSLLQDRTTQKREVKVFFSSKKYFSNPILMGAGDVAFK